MQIGQGTKMDVFAIVKSVLSPIYLLFCTTRVTDFTNHCSLLFAFRPTEMEPSLGRKKVVPVIRWDFVPSHIRI